LLCVKTKSGAHKQLTFYFQMRKYFSRHLHSSLISMTQRYPNFFQLLYNVKPGSSNKSFGLEVARLAGFPAEVMDDAKLFLAQAEMPLLRGGKQVSVL
jgi:DNA mismatch repair ATPase MutS